MSNHPADRLLDAIAERGTAACVGIDPVWERLPMELRPETADSDALVEAVATFSRAVIDAVAPAVPAVKLQSACYERWGGRGVAVLEGAIEYARSLGLRVILDAKRGDIGLSAEHYAAAAEAADAEWVTINSYFGPDGVTPFLQKGRGAFALVRTSNPGGDLLQSLPLQDGRSVAEAVAEMIAAIGEDHIGEKGYSSLGAVVAATKPHDAAAMRARMPRQIFLVPGYGAQGGTAETVRACFHDDGRGAVITAGRSVIYAFDTEDPQWRDSVASAARRFAEEVSGVTADMS